jgi:hypothetical protein
LGASLLEVGVVNLGVLLAESLEAEESSAEVVLRMLVLVLAPGYLY